MKNTSKILVVIVSMIITSAVNAQYSINKSKLSDVQQLEKVDFFEMKELSDKQIKYYKRQGNIENIQEQYQIENLFLTNLISENWNSSTKPKEITTSELNSKIKKNEGTWYVTIRKHSDRFFDRRVVKKNYYYSYSHYQLSLYKDKKEVLRIPLVD